MIYNPFKFDLEKSYEAIGVLLAEADSKKKKISVYRLLSLLYLADREYLKQTNQTITGDVYEYTINYLVTPSSIGEELISNKNRFFKVSKDYQSVLMKKQPKLSKLCKLNIEVLKSIYKQFEIFKDYILSQYMQSLPEIKNFRIIEKFSAIRIAEHLDFSQERIDDIMWEEIQHRRVTELFNKTEEEIENGKTKNS